MNWKHLFWIVPLAFLVGVISYAMLEEANTRLMNEQFNRAIIGTIACENAVGKCLPPENFSCYSQTVGSEWIRLSEVIS